jgi:putative aldouronate transport system permease protein
MSIINVSGKSMPARRLFVKQCKKQKGIIFASAFFATYIFIFSYVPVWGWLMAFQNYNPAAGILKSPWVGFKHFQELFADAYFAQVIRNTLAMSFINIILGFASAILLAILLNEIKSSLFKRTIQTISYLPHFVSWVVAANIVLMSLSVEDGVINNALQAIGVIQKPVLWMGEPNYFWWIIGFSNVWKEVGWNAIIYLASISSIDPNLYEAASIDGAGRVKKILYITLPGLIPIIRVLLIMQCGWILSTGFEQQLLLQNSMVLDVAEVLDTFTLRYGISMNRYSFATAAGIFKSVVSIILILSANKISKKVSGEGIM